MASRVTLEFQQQPPERKALLMRHKNRRSLKSETKTQKILDTTSQDLENYQQLPICSSFKNFDIRMVSYKNQKIQTHAINPVKKPRQRSESPSNPKLSSRHLTFRSKRNSFSPVIPETKIIKPKPASQEEFDLMPATEGKTYYNERIRWNKRKKGNLPLCIINFNGVLGDYSKTTFWSGESGKFLLVDGVAPGLKLLSSEFYTVIVSWFSREITKVLMTLLEDYSLFYDAVYLVRHRKRKYRFRHNYTQIYDDFRICNVFGTVVVVNPIVLSREELSERKGLEIFYEASLSGCNKYSTIGLPIACSDDTGMPLCVLVPHYRLSDEHISMFDLAKSIVGIKNICLGDLSKAECDGQVKMPCEHEEIPLIPLHPKEYVGCGTRYVLFMQCRVKQQRPPLIRKPSRIKKF